MYGFRSNLCQDALKSSSYYMPLVFPEAGPGLPLPQQLIRPYHALTRVMLCTGHT